jgi:cyclase
MRLISRIDIKNEYVVKGICFEGLRKLGNPEDFCVKYYNDSSDELLICDIVASLYGRNNLFEIIKKITKNVFIPVCLSGGIRTLSDIKNALSAGADKVGINTAVVNNINFLKSACKNFGISNIVVSVEAKRVDENKWEVYTHNGRERTEIDVLDWLKKISNNGCGEILITSIDKDGTNSGFDYDLVMSISKLDLTIPIIYSGGCGSMQDVRKIKNLIVENDAIAIGSQLHYENLSIENIKKKIKL